uniref:Ion_trans domain-containing protein n=1 Tax=Macrostomum lignano TaxID=282301 RepID=A0A1I8FE24_9PLAT
MLMPPLAYVTFGVDLAVALLFTAEIVTRMKLRGVWRGPEAYFRHGWCRFDFSMTLFLWLSIGLQSFELRQLLLCLKPLSELGDCPTATAYWRDWGWLSVLRSRARGWCWRSGKQVFNVTIFLAFFMALFGILGVQCFGESLKMHCVLKTADTKNVTIQDLAIPDTRCFDNTSCPVNMMCIRIINDKDKKEMHYNGFDNFHVSFFTVYQAASKEGCLPTRHRWKSVAYFVGLIFFLVWLVKNVFIAVLIETFAEIRVQFKQMWTRPQSDSGSDGSRMLQVDGQAWRLVAVDDSQPRGWAPAPLVRLARSTGFSVIVMLLVLANSFVAAGVHFNHDRQARGEEGSGSEGPSGSVFPFQAVENMFTVLFDIEAIFKILCFGWRGYWSQSLHKFELCLCIFTSLRLVPGLFWTHLAYFQVLRVVRLIKASPMLEDFCFKIFGPVKKLGTLVVFTISLLVITSTISLQLFCFIPSTGEYGMFTTFPNLENQNGTNERVSTLSAVAGGAGPTLAAMLTAAYYWYPCTSSSSWLGEDVKEAEAAQDDARSQAETQQKLPLRLRVFEEFPNRPQMIKLWPPDWRLTCCPDPRQLQCASLPLRRCRPAVDMDTTDDRAEPQADGPIYAGKLHNLLNNEGKTDGRSTSWHGVSVGSGESLA